MCRGVAFCPVRPFQPIGQDICGKDRHGEVHVARNVIRLIDARIGRCLRRRSEKDGQMCAGGKSESAYPLRLVAALSSLSADDFWEEPLSSFQSTER
jgi:hypothetical protein